MRRRAIGAALLGSLMALTGCLGHTRKVAKTRAADVVMDATLDQLVKRLDGQFDGITSMSASIEITAGVRDSAKGEVTEHTFSGYLFMRKPESLRVLLLLPVIRTRAVDMVSDGKNFKLLIPPLHTARTGSNEVTVPSANGLENLRPGVFFDSLLIRKLEPEQIASLTSDTRVVNLGTEKKQDLVETPDYDVSMMAAPQGQEAHTKRVVHFNSADLQPYQQDIYDATGHVATRVTYSEYKKFGDLMFPTKVNIERPRDNYSLTMLITKLTLNQTLSDDQFVLDIPSDVKITKMP